MCWTPNSDLREWGLAKITCKRSRKGSHAPSLSFSDFVRKHEGKMGEIQSTRESLWQNKQEHECLGKGCDCLSRSRFSSLGTDMRRTLASADEMPFTPPLCAINRPPTLLHSDVPKAPMSYCPAISIDQSKRPDVNKHNLDIMQCKKCRMLGFYSSGGWFNRGQLNKGSAV